MNKLNNMEKYSFWKKVKEFSSLLYFLNKFYDDVSYIYWNKLIADFNF